MVVNKESYYSLDDIVNNMKSFVRYLLKKWLFLLLAAILGVGLGTAAYYRQRPKYKAVSTFILEEKSAGGGGLAGLASQFGFNVGSLNGGGSIFTGDNILSILRSKKVVEDVLLSNVDDTSFNTKTLADFYLGFSGIKKSWEKKSMLTNFSFANDKKKLSPVQDSILNVIYETIVKQALLTERSSKQGTIIKVQVTSADCLFARLMTERLIEQAGRLYLDIKTGTAQANIDQLQRRSDSLLSLVNRKSYATAVSQPLDINPGIKTAMVPVEISIRDKTVLASLYTEVTKNLEMSKLLLSQQTPVIQLLDKPGILLDDNKKSVYLLILLYSLSVILLSVIFQFLVFILKGNKKRPS